MPEGSKVFPIAPIRSTGRSLLWVGLGLTTVLFVQLVVVVVSDRTPGKAGDVIVIGILGLVVTAILAAVAGLGWMVPRAKATVFEVDRDGLRIRSPIYPRTFAREVLKLDDALIIPMADAARFTPLMSYGPMLGINLPGLCLGTYKLRDRSISLLYVAYPFVGPIIYLPTTGPYHLILSPADPAGFLEELRNLKTADESR